jgi:hypothetical protein
MLGSPSRHNCCNALTDLHATEVHDALTLLRITEVNDALALNW